MKKIGIVTEYFYPHLGGITEHVYYLAKELSKRGYEVVILTGYEGEEVGVRLPPSLRVIHLGKSVPFFLNGSFAKVTIGSNLGQKVQAVLKEEKFDLLHIHSPIFMVLPLLFLKYSDTVTVGTFHAYLDSFGAGFFSRFFKGVIQKYLEKLDGRIAVAPSCIQAMDRYFEADYTLIPNGVETDWFANPAGKVQRYDDGKANILFLGRLDPRNGLDVLLDAFPRVEKILPKTRLLVVGDGPLRAYYERKAGSHLGEKIFFEGQINGNRPDYFATSHVFCYPATKASSFGITLLEAMAAGKPVVAADNPGFRAVIQHDVNGLLAPCNDSKKLAETLIRVLTDRDLAQRLVVNGGKTAEQHSWTRVTNQILDFYDCVYRKIKGTPFTLIPQ